MEAITTGTVSSEELNKLLREFFVLLRKESHFASELEDPLHEDAGLSEKQFSELLKQVLPRCPFIIIALGVLGE